jgi:hypothetical protein
MGVGFFILKFLIRNQVGISIMSEQVYYFIVSVAVVAVILGLVYIGMQIRGYVDVARESVAHKLMEEFRSLYTLMMQDEGLSGIFRRGMHDIENINVADKFRFTLIVHNFFRLYEDAYYLKSAGGLEPRHWHGMTEQFHFLKDLSGFQVFWRDRKFLFSEDFRNYYENEVLPAEAHTKFDYQ